MVAVLVGLFTEFEWSFSFIHEARIDGQWKLGPLSVQRTDSQVHSCAAIFCENAGCVHQHATLHSRSVSRGLLYIYQVEIENEEAVLQDDRSH